MADQDNSSCGSHSVKRISPMLAAEDMQKTLAFYKNVLRFNIIMEGPEYSIVEKDGASIHFMKAADEKVMQAVRGHTEIYIEVANIHALWDHVKTFKHKYKMTEISDRSYGMTEFHISDPNECLVFIGQETGSAGGFAE